MTSSWIVVHIVVRPAHYPRLHIVIPSPRSSLLDSAQGRTKGRKQEGKLGNRARIALLHSLAVISINHISPSIHLYILTYIFLLLTTGEEENENENEKSELNECRRSTSFSCGRMRVDPPLKNSFISTSHHHHHHLNCNHLLFRPQAADKRARELRISFVPFTTRSFSFWSPYRPLSTCCCCLLVSLSVSL